VAEDRSYGDGVNAGHGATIVENVHVENAREKAALVAQYEEARSAMVVTQGFGL